MDTTETQSRIRRNIAWMEYCHQCRRRRESNQKPEVKLGLPSAYGAPSSQARLPKPEYVTTANLIGHDDKEIEFYAACELGLFTRVETFIRQHRPSQAVRQYGLELASFALQPVVAQHLLDQSTILHEGVVRRSWNDPGTEGDVNLFDTNRTDPVPMLRVFLESGWDPNQMWSEHGVLNTLYKNPITYTVKNKAFLDFLLSHGTAIRTSVDITEAYDNAPLGERESWAFNTAVKDGNPATFDLLVRYGLDPRRAHPFHSLAGCQGFGAKPFHQRRPMAEHVLSLQVAGVNDIRYMTFLDLIASPSQRGENMTPFIYACAAQDWEYAEWLLEKGADPYMLNRRAFDPLVFAYGAGHRPSDPKDVMRLVDKVWSRLNGQGETGVQRGAMMMENNPAGSYLRLPASRQA